MTDGKRTEQKVAPSAFVSASKSLSSSPSLSLAAVLNASQTHPFIGRVDTYVPPNTVHWKYHFHCWPESESSHTLLAKVEITQIGCPERCVRNYFKLLPTSDSAYVLSCNRIQGSTILSPAITIPVEYNRRLKAWVGTSSFKNISALFTFNNFIEGLGMLATCTCTDATVQFGPEHALTIVCHTKFGYSWPAVVPDELSPDDEFAHEPPITGSPAVAPTPQTMGMPSSTESTSSDSLADDPDASSFLSTKR